jgi:hypothetical protein
MCFGFNVLCNLEEKYIRAEIQKTITGERVRDAWQVIAVTLQVENVLWR